MNLQYISDSKGKTTGVYIPIEEWNNLKEKYEGFNDYEVGISDLHKNIVRERLLEYIKNSKISLDFDDTLDEIEKNL